MEKTSLISPKLISITLSNISSYFDVSIPAKQKNSLIFILSIQESSISWQVIKTYDEMIKCYNKHKSKLPNRSPTPKSKTFNNLNDSEKVKTFETLYSDLFKYPQITNTPYFKEFLEISCTSFQNILKKGKEGYIKKQTGGRVGNDSKCFNCSRHFKRFQKRWLIVRDTGIYLSKSIENDEMSEYLMFDKEITFNEGPSTGFNLGIAISNSKRKLLVKARSYLQLLDWVKALKTAAQLSDYTGEKIYGSLYPPRPDNKVKVFVDGEDYFRKVYQKIKSAKAQVLISDWWLSPELYLKRPARKNEKSMLINVLRKIAENGVSVYVHVYKEVSSALTLNSKHTVNQLRAAHHNIRAIRHPKRSIYGGEFLWSHHEKVISIDQEIAFLGGLDLCYGRFDTHKHPLKDLKQDLFNGIDYSNSRIQDFSNVQDWKPDQLDRKSQPRMPWHDVGLMIKGNAAYDVSVNFIELWNHVMTDFYGWYNSNKKDLLTPFATRPIKTFYESVYEESKETEFSPSVFNESIELAQEAQEIQRKRMKTIEERKSITLDMADEVKSQEYELKRSFKKVASQGTCKCQIVRSAGLWSYGVKVPDCSIQNAYKQMIAEAQNFVYIENQFFISSTAGNMVVNDIAKSLVEKIKDKAEKHEKFKVIVVIPLLPGFAGEADSSAILRIQLHWEYQTICRSPTSIYSQLTNAGIRPEDYIRFYGLRNHTLFGETPVSEIVYVHSKYMIVDDKKLIMGSANINDRSMTGTHDSEIAVVVEDRNLVEIKVDGKPCFVSKTVHDLRIKIFKEFSGEKDAKKLEDVFSNEFYKEWEGNAENNTVKYRNLFGCYPDDTILRNSDLERVKVKSPNYKLYNSEKEQIKGFLVNFPLDFLKDEDLTFKLTDVERIVPMKSFI